MRRPLMWICILGIAVAFLIRLVLYNLNPPPEFENQIELTGRVYKKEIKNNRPVLYLKECSVKDFSSSGENSGYPKGSSAEIKSKDYSQNVLSENSRTFRIKGVICYLDGYEGEPPASLDDYPLGSSLMLNGKISIIKKATNPGEFDARRYYLARGYEYCIFDPAIKACTDGSFVGETLFRLKEKGCNILLSEVGEKYGGVLCGILFGNKNHLSPELKDLFTDGGIAHILAISGLHVSLIGAFLYAVLNHRPVPGKAAFALTILILVLYGISVGFAPSVFRAIFMFSYRLLAKLLKKPYDAPTSLALSAFLTCLFFPFMLTDSSFLLTYLSVTGILLIYPLFIPFVNRKKKSVDGLYIGFSVFISSLPVLAASFHQVSLAGFILNFFVIPAMPVLFVCAFGVIFFCRWLHPAAVLLGIICRAILFTFSFGSEKLTELPFTVIGIKTPSEGRILIYTTIVVLLAVLCTGFRRKMKLAFYRMKQKGDGGNGNSRNETGGNSYDTEYRGFCIVETAYRIGIFLVFALLCLFLLSESKKPRITFLDVGQGDAVFIRTESKDVFMIDGGSTSKKDVGKNILVPYLKYEGENSIDLWFLTHEDEDHVSGFREVLQSGEIKVEMLAVPYVLKDNFSEITGLANQKGVEVVYLEEGDRIGTESERTNFYIASPNPENHYADSNDASFAILYQEGELTAVFMGDSGASAEGRMLKCVEKYGDRCVEILKCAHHGSSAGSNSEEFINALSPDVGIISCGLNNRYGHPHKETLQRLEKTGCRIMRTDLDGAIVLDR